MNLAPFIDHTVLKNTTTSNEVAVLCNEAIQYGFAAVCVPPYYVREAKRIVADNTVKVATVIGFPFGYHHYKTKLAEAATAIKEGADELDMVMNLAAFKSKDTASVEAEADAISTLAANENKTLKLIIESGILSDEEIITCCNLYCHFPIQFLKTSTGFGGNGASVHAVQLMRKHLPAHIQIKASGGICTYDFAKELTEAGATRLGCSASVPIINAEPPQEGY